MSKTYHVLWVDDEHDDDDLLPFVIQAEQKNILLDGFSNFEDGFNTLEGNINHYDAILLDALFFETSDSKTPNPAGLGSALKKINELLDRKAFPHFVLSGQTNFTEETNPILEAFQLRCYNKKNPEDVKELLQNIQSKADEQEDLQIKHEHQNLFKVLSEYPNSSRDTFISIFKGMKGLNNGFDDELYFTQLRKILENLFRKANKIGLLHDKCVQKNGDQVNLTESYLFLAGADTRHLKVKCSKTHFPKLISKNVKNILRVTGAASHTSEVDETEKIDIDTYRNSIKTSYLLYSLALQLMDVVLWFDSYSKSNTDVAKNKSYWETFEITRDGQKYETGTIKRVSDRGWGTVEYGSSGKTDGVHPGDMGNLSLNKGDRIKFTIQEKKFTKNIEKI